MIQKMKTEHNLLERSLEYDSNEMGSQEVCKEENNNLVDALNLIETDFNKTKIMISQLSIHINNVNVQLSNG
jgi:hypothetical protein